MANVANVLFKVYQRADWELITPAGSTFYRVINPDNSEDFYLGSKKLNNQAEIDAAIAALDGSATIASKSGDVVTIKAGITEVDGIVDNNSGTDIVLEEVAVTGAAADVSYSATIGSTTVTNVDDALDALAAQSSGGVASKTIWFTDDSAGQSDYAKVYKLYQGANAPDAETSPAALVGTINIPKDKVLQDASIVDITYDATEHKLYDGLVDVTELIKGAGGTATAADAGKYLKMEMQNVTDPLYVNLQTFVDVYTVESGATEIQLAINNHEISASVVSIDGSKVVYKTETSAGAGDGETVKQALQRLDGSASTTGSVAKVAKDTADAAIAALDTTNDVTIASQSGDVVTIKAGISETDGIIGAGSGSDITLAVVATTGDSEDVAYSNTTSGLTATDVQAAIDEIASTAGSAVQSVTEGSTNGTIDVDGTDVAVHGLGSAAFADTTDFDVAGAASTAESNAEDYARGLLTWEVVTPAAGD